MKERVFSFEEFQRRVDKGKPVHWTVYEKCVDPKHGVFYRFWLSVTGLDPEDGHIIEFYQETTTVVGQKEEQEKVVKEWREKYVKPLNATPGEWLPK
jgi:hypothetical protein